MSRRGWIALAALGLAWTAAPALAGDDVRAVLAEITAGMKGVESVQAAFVEEKSLAMFAQPVLLKGTLAWARPDSFAWRVRTPVQMVMVMQNGVFRQWDGDSRTVQEFSLSGNPVMRVASQQLQRWFAGEYERLADEYDVSLVSRRPLVLACVPRAGSPEAGFVTRVTIRFRQDLRYLQEIAIDEASGDATRIRFESARLNEPVPADAWVAGPARAHD